MSPRSRLTAITLLGLALLPLSGCLRSLHPLYTEESLVFEPKLLGKWSEEADSEEFWLFEQAGGEKEYRVTIHDPNEEAPAVLSGHLVRVGEDLFLDLSLDDVEVKGGTWVEMHLLPAHTFLRIKQVRPTLQMAVMNPEKAGKLLGEKPDAVKHEMLGEDEDTPVLTAKPEELQTFINTYKDTAELFGDYSEMIPADAKTEETKKADSKPDAEEKQGDAPKKDASEGR